MAPQIKGCLFLIALHCVQRGVAMRGVAMRGVAMRGVAMHGVADNASL